MEQEELYKAAQTKVNGLTATLVSLDEFSFAKALVEVHKDIETHFEMLFKVLQQRKDHLISAVDKLSQELQNRIEVEKKELAQKIQATKKIIDCGVCLYEFQRDTALEMWEKTSKIIHENTERKGVQVAFPALEETINSHGTVFSEAVVPLKPKVLFKAAAVRTLAGSTPGCVDGQGVNAKFNYPFGIVLNPLDDCLYVCDSDNNMIRKVTPSGNVSKFVDCPNPTGIAFYQKDKCYFVSSQENHLIKRISLQGEVSTYAGNGMGGGYQNGERMNVMFNYPWGIAVNQDTGDVYISDYNNHVIRKITQGQVSTLAGTPEKNGYSDGIQSTLFNRPRGICFHSQQQALIVCDTGNNRLWKILLDGTVSTICEIRQPDSVGVLSDGSILVSSSGTHQIFKVSFKDKIETEVFAGSGKRGNKDGAPLESQFYNPFGIAIDHKSNNCFVADYGNHRMRTIHYD